MRLPAFLALLLLAASPAHAADVPRIIFDTDMATDCDDAGALAVLHVLANQGECEILATVSSSLNPTACAAVDVINRYYHRPDLPMGTVKGQGVGEERKEVKVRRTVLEGPAQASCISPKKRDPAV